MTLSTRHEDQQHTRDEDLAALSASDLDAFARLYERYENKIFRFLRSQMGDNAAAEDLTAYVFFRAFRSASTFREEGSYGAWIFRIARNAVASWHEQRTRTEIPMENLPDAPDATISILRDTVVEEEREAVRQTVANLPEAQREVIDLRYWHDLSVDEIAAHTRRSSGAVRQLLFRARQRLGRRLSPTDVSALLGAAAGASAVVALSYRHKKGER